MQTDCRIDERRTIALLFDEQSARTPQATALVSAERELTYAQLHDSVDRLAGQLRSMGVASEAPVGVFMDRSLEMIIAILAILKAGGAYLPLDPAYPSERIELMVDDSGTSLILTTARVRNRLPTVVTTVFAVDAAATAAPELSEPLRCTATATNLAYIIYTSGSTGRPKGVMVEHRNVLSFFAAMDSVLGTDPGVWLAVTSICFDISVLELLWTLTRGFKVVLDGSEGVHTIASEIGRYGVTHFQSTPSLARMLATDTRSLVALGSLRMLLLGGEALPAALAATLLGRIGGEIYNMYGPTETTVWSTFYRIGAGRDGGTIVPIGQPLSNTRAYVLDQELRPVADGEPGELFLGGDGVARGYWGWPALTEERFLPDRFAGRGRMYRTGDIARVLSDGNLEFLGRTDFQVKLGGHRIEPAEIEAALEQDPLVRQAVVVAREDRPGDKRLVAYIVPTGGATLEPAALRAGLEAKLPEYMVPGHLVFLDRLPLTPNGKIDRTALPLVRSRPAVPAPAVPPDEDAQQRLERIIVAVWASALGVDQVGVDVNLFDLGATSLMVPDVQLELQRRLNREISLIELFEFHTARTLARHLAGNSAEASKTNRAERRLAARHQERSR
jgi:amino acid adenylation domain-containing protein